MAGWMPQAWGEDLAEEEAQPPKRKGGRWAGHTKVGWWRRRAPLSCATPPLCCCRCLCRLPFAAALLSFDSDAFHRTLEVRSCAHRMQTKRL